MDIQPPLTLLAAGALLGALPAVAQRIEHPAALRVQGEELGRFRLLRGDPPAKHYPEAARRQGIDGVVIVDVMINETGQVLEAQVISETPRNQGFGIAALDAAKTFEFENPLRRWVVFTLTIEFLP
ncbi:MAG: energy transducer TonB [Pseudomonadota bacterium]|jgi:TonB family protein|nr:MAG: hypothetical protein DIU62_00435 [Pseudomonadota bacterium]